MSIAVRWDSEQERVFLGDDELLAVPLELAHGLKFWLRSLDDGGALPVVPLSTSVAEGMIEKLELFEAFGVLRLRHVDSQNQRKAMSVAMDRGVLQDFIAQLAELPKPPVVVLGLQTRSGNSHWPRVTQRLSRGRG